MALPLSSNPNGVQLAPVAHRAPQGASSAQDPQQLLQALLAATGRAAAPVVRAPAQAPASAPLLQKNPVNYSAGPAHQEMPAGNEKGSCEEVSERCGRCCLQMMDCCEESCKCICICLGRTAKWMCENAPAIALGICIAESCRNR